MIRRRQAGPRPTAPAAPPGRRLLGTARRNEALDRGAKGLFGAAAAALPTRAALTPPDDRTDAARPGLHVQYGCGYSAPAEWTNFDASPTLRWERIPLLGSLWTKNAERFPANVRVGDIVRGLPVAERSCRGVYASHVLEHLALDEFHRALDNTLKILGEGGIFRLVVPDLEWAAREYVRRLDATRDPTASDFLMRETYLGTPRRARGLVGLVYRWLSTSSHLWMWDEASLAQALTAHGFRAVRRCQFGDCEDPLFARVEDRERFVHAVAMEARR